MNNIQCLREAETRIVGFQPKAEAHQPNHDLARENLPDCTYGLEVRGGHPERLTLSMDR